MIKLPETARRNQRRCSQQRKKAGLQNTYMVICMHHQRPGTKKTIKFVRKDLSFWMTKWHRNLFHCTYLQNFLAFCRITVSDQVFRRNKFHIREVGLCFLSNRCSECCLARPNRTWTMKRSQSATQVRGRRLTNRPSMRIDSKGVRSLLAACWTRTRPARRGERKNRK